MFVADPKSGIDSLKALIERAKAAPDTISYASPGIGSTPHLAGEMLKLAAGIKLIHVPFNGAGPAIQGVLGSTTQLACTALAPAQPHIQSATLNGIALTGTKRWSDLPNLPTTVELGFPDLVTDTWQGFLAPAKTPPEVLAALGRAVTEILADPAVADQLHRNAFDVLSTSPDEFRTVLTAEVAKWRTLIKAAGIQPI